MNRRHKQRIYDADTRLTNYAVQLSRKNLKIHVGLLIGHITLNCHRTVLGKKDNPLRPFCAEGHDIMTLVNSS